MTTIIIQRIIQMFVIMVIGFGAVKIKLLDGEAAKKMSTLLTMVVSPIVIFTSYQTSFDPALFQGLLWSFLLSFVSYVITIILSFIVVRPNDNDAIERFAIVYSNCGFIGIPLINGLIGSEGVFYMTGYITMYNVFVWTHGLILMRGKPRGFLDTLRNIVTPSTVSIVISLVLFLGGIILPALILDPLNSIANMNTPLAMLVAGCTLAETDIVSALKRSRTYLISFWRLIASPLLTLLVLMVAPVSANVALTVLVAAACPVGAMVTMLAMQFGRDHTYGVQLFTVTTIMTLITMPLVITLGMQVL